MDTKTAPNNGSDYSEDRGVADEPHWNDFVQSIGGQLVGALIKRQGVQNADYMFEDGKVFAELKILETEFAYTEQAMARLNALAERSLAESWDAQKLTREVINVLRIPIQRIIKKANRQLRETKKELGREDWNGLLICVNDSYRGIPPVLTVAIISDILAGANYSSITGFVYLTNHYIEIAESPDAVLLWDQRFDERASEEFRDWVINLGRKWRIYSESKIGPMDSSDELNSIDWSRVHVVRGSGRVEQYQRKQAGAKAPTFLSNLASKARNVIRRCLSALSR